MVWLEIGIGLDGSPGTKESDSNFGPADPCSRPFYFVPRPPSLGMISFMRERTLWAMYKQILLGESHFYATGYKSSHNDCGMT